MLDFSIKTLSDDTKELYVDGKMVASGTQEEVLSIIRLMTQHEALEKVSNNEGRGRRKIKAILEPTMTKSNHTIVLVRKIELRPCDCRSESTVKKVPYEARRVELKIPDEVVFAENNWVFGGSVEPSGVDGKNFVNVDLSGENLGFTVPTRYFSLNHCTCDYCKTNRQRNKTYLVVNQETGEWKQLGKECLKLFVTGIDIDAIATFESFIKDAEDAANPGDEFFYNKGFKFVKIADALALAYAVYRERGYLATRDSVGNPNDLCNKNIVQRKLAQQYGCNSDFLNITNSTRDKIDALTVKADINAAKDAIGDVEQLPDDPYYNNLKVVVANEYIPLNKLGLLVSIPKAIDRYEEEKRRQEEKEKLAAESNYLGSVGEKISVNFVSGREVACCETQFVLLHIYEFKDANGNAVVWKSSSSKDIPKSGTVTGTVKAHEEYNGIKQTIILRAKIAA